MKSLIYANCGGVFGGYIAKSAGESPNQIGMKTLNSPAPSEGRFG